MTIIDEITNLVSILPEQDIKLALQFINTRQFEQLKYLVDSDVIKLQQQSLQYPVNTTEYFIALSTLDNCLQLQQQVNKYLDQLGILDDYSDDDLYELSDEYDDNEYYDHLYYMYNINKTI